MRKYTQYSYCVPYKASKYKAIYMVYIFSNTYYFLLSLSAISHFLLTSINYLPAKAYVHSVRLFVILQLLILQGLGGDIRMPCITILNSILDSI